MPTGQADIQEELHGPQDIQDFRAPPDLHQTFLSLFDFPKEVEDLPFVEDPDEDFDDSEEAFSIDGSLKDLEPTTVIYILEDILGPEWWKDDGEVIFLVLMDKFTLDEADRNMIYAIQALFPHSGFWTEWEIFNWVTQACDGRVTDFTYLPALEPEEMMVSMLAASFVARLQNASANYAPEVISYIAAHCLMRGVWSLPFPLSVAQDRALKLLSLQGHQDTPIALVQDKALKGDYEKDPKDPIDAQAAWYAYLVEFRARRLRESQREIEAYRRRGKV